MEIHPQKTQVSPFDYTRIPLGYYDEMMRAGNPIRRCWHRQKFERVIAALPKRRGLSLLDIGCFAGTFLSLLPTDRFSRQLGVDILPDQIAWAIEHYGNDHRQFRYLPRIEDLDCNDEQFDCITLIEVIEHLNADEIRALLAQVARLLRPGGSFLMTTPNYASTWPLLEIILNRVSAVTYEEQHLTKFRYFGFEKKVRGLAPEFAEVMALDLKTTSHFLSPFLAAVSEPLAMQASKFRKPHRWPFPFGNLVLARFRKEAAR